jgi:hypothetical protein
MTTAPSSRSRPRASRGRIFRDVALLQFKLMLGNLHNFLLVPVTIFAGAIDIVFKNRTDEALFYKVLAWGRGWEETIGVYNALRRDEDAFAREKYNVDALLARVEAAAVAEYQRREVSAKMKDAVNKAAERVHVEAARQKSRFARLVPGSHLPDGQDSGPDESGRS